MLCCHPVLSSCSQQRAAAASDTRTVWFQTRPDTTHCAVLLAFVLEAATLLSRAVALAPGNEQVAANHRAVLMILAGAAS